MPLIFYFTMKKLFLTFSLVFVALAAVASDIDDPTSCRNVFNWTDPSSLDPAYPAPNSGNRYGEYISNVTFKTNAGINSFYLTIDDSNVKEQSQRARFLFGYNTQKVEMRAYPGSYIKISTKKNYISWIEFTGPKVDNNYLECLGEDAEYKDGRWYVNPSSSEVEFYVHTTINCFTTECMHSTADVSEVAVDSDDDDKAVWYTLDGCRLASRPDVPGVYIRRGAQVTKVLIK